MSKVVEMFREQVKLRPDHTAFFNSVGESMSYAQLDAISEQLGHYFCELDAEKRPVVLYGHKSPFMVVGIVACMKSGRPFVPIDSLYPMERIASIVEQIDKPILINTTNKDMGNIAQKALKIIDLEYLSTLPHSSDNTADSELEAIRDMDPVYILFTSGSTGKPKGVVQHTKALDIFTDHFIKTILRIRDDDVLYNRSPFSFDTAIFDLFPSLATGATMFASEETTEQSFSALFAAFEKSEMTAWISTPSFLEACLLDPSFTPDLLPRLRTVVVTGEALHSRTVLRLLDRFPELEIFNSYGATETQGCCDMLITKEIAQAGDPLPVGLPSMGMTASIRKPEDGSEVPPKTEGEIYLVGPMVSLGYYKDPERTAKVFSTEEVAGKEVSVYKTGDRGFLDEKGWLYCLGRYDFQVKLGGYRIELGDIEAHLCALPEVSEACVVPVFKNEKVSHLCAFIQLAEGHTDTSFEQTKNLKAKLGANLPSYMIPRSFKYLAILPSNVNGKVDRKLLREMATEHRA